MEYTRHIPIVRCALPVSREFSAVSAPPITIATASITQLWPPRPAALLLLALSLPLLLLPIPPALLLLLLLLLSLLTLSLPPLLPLLRPAPPPSPPTPALPFGRMRFRPQLFWQELLPQHVADASLQFHADLSSGKTYARLPSDTTYAADGALAAAAAVALPAVDEREHDFDAVSLALRAAAAWGDARRLTQLLCSCHCGVAHLAGALHEAAARGEAECVRRLLAAGARAEERRGGRTALHAACEAAGEEAAALLLAACPALAGERDERGRTPLELAVERDHAPLARRLRAWARQVEAEAPSGGESAQAVRGSSTVNGAVASG
ncbi:hypothetical protein AB1Y20_016387 [Prymnesium parvum]|uniref:Uncharacterized protein n=1 Tax=Prymnesium parvum TaxID=97485 RepID=A0AB34ID57_PRYPA